MSSGFGGALLRVMGESTRTQSEAPTASKADALLIVDTLLESADTRSRCAALANLVSEAKVENRKEVCRALLILMWTERLPPEGEVPDKTHFVATTNEYCSMAAPLPGSRWAHHIEASYRKHGSAEWVRVSPFMAEVIRAFESLFGIPGSMITSS